MTILAHDLGTYLVESDSRPGEHHIVDDTELTCSCEAFANRERLGILLCKHLTAVVAQRRTLTVDLLDDASPLLLANL